MTNVVEWQLKISESGAAKLARLIDKIAGAGTAAAAGVGNLSVATERAAAAAESLTSSGVAVRRIIDIGETSRSATPAVVELGDKMADTAADAEGLAAKAAATAKRMDELRAAARKASAPTDQERMINAAKPSDLIAQEGAIKRHLALMEKLRAASRVSAGATDAEKMIGAAMPAHLKAAPELSLAQRAVRRLLMDVNQITGGRALGAVSALSQRFERMAPALEIARGVASRMGPVFSAIGSGALFAAKGVGVLAAAGVAAGAGFATAVVKAQATREGIMKGLEVQLKSRALAEQTMVRATRTADMLGESRMVVAGQFNDLLAKGFDVTRVDEIVKRMADLRIVDPKADQAGITRAISQIAGTGKLQGDELNQLAENGLETIAVYDAIGKKLNKTRAEVIKLKEAGKIDSDTAIQGILDAIGNQTGNKAPGAVAADAARESLDGILRRFSNLPENLLSSIGVDKELGTIKGSMNEVLTYFETTGQSKIATALESTFGALVKGFTGIDVNGPGGLTNTIDTILTGIIEARPQIESFAAGVRQAFEIGGAIIRVVGWFSQMSESADRLVTRFGPLGAAVREGFLGPFEFGTNAIRGMVGAINTLSSIGLGGWVANMQTEVINLASSMYTGAVEVGTQIVAGIEAGVMGAYSRAIDAVSNVAGGAIAAAKAILGIKSPSKVFEEIGAFTVAGFERGIAANDGGALESLVAPPDLSAIAGGAAAMAGRAGGMNITIEEGAIQVDARGVADPQRVSELVQEGVLRTFESLGLATGAAA